MLSTIDIEEFARMAGLDLSPRQTADLREMLYQHPETNRWRWPEWHMTHEAPNLIAARALLGFLLLDENVLWVLPTRLALRDGFDRMVHAVSQLGTQTEPPSLFDLDGITVKIRRANGEELLERLDTSKWIRFAYTHYAGSCRGYSADILIADGALTEQQRVDVLPTMATCRNPQVIYA